MLFFNKYVLTIADLILEDIEDLEEAVFSEEEEQLNRYCVQDFYDYYHIHLINAFWGSPRQN